MQWAITYSLRLQSNDLVEHGIRTSTDDSSMVETKSYEIKNYYQNNLNNLEDVIRKVV